MKVSKDNIRNIHKYLPGLKNGDVFYIACSDIKKHHTRLKKAGFSNKLELGERILPAPVFGLQSVFNAEGKAIPLKDKPMETAYRQADWHWKDWGGYWHSKIVDVPYDRYPRRLISPPGVEIQILVKVDEEKIIASEKLWYEKDDYERIRCAMKLFLEMFGEFEVFNEDLLPAFTAPIKKLNWEVLPKGVYPWKTVKGRLQLLIEGAKQGNQSVIIYRLERINKAKPNFLATGRAGFRGYIIFGFEERNIYVLESIYHGNATYVFEEDWEDLSKKTKAEILNARLQKHRIIHREGWDAEIGKVLRCSIQLRRKLERS